MDYKARLYDAFTGRFIQPDTLVPEPGSSQGYNRYAYVNNNPVRYTDPTGNCTGYSWCYIPTTSPSGNGIDGGQDISIVDEPEIISRDEWNAHDHGSFGNQSDIDSEGMYDPDSNPNGYKKYEGNLADIYDTVVIHHEGDFQTYNVLTVQEAEMWEGFYDIGYSFIIGPDGKIYEGRDITYRGNNVFPNTRKIGVLWLGDFNPGIGENHNSSDVDDIPTQAQVQSTIRLISWLDNLYGIQTIAGHNAFNQPGNTALCPGSNALPYIQQINDYFGR